MGACPEGYNQQTPRVVKMILPSDRLRRKANIELWKQISTIASGSLSP